jgi:hypothetical protein
MTPACGWPRVFGDPGFAAHAFALELAYLRDFTGAIIAGAR